MAAYAGYIPVAQTRYLMQGLFSEEKFAQLMATGVLNLTNIEENIIKRGDAINLPQAIQIDDLTDVDLTLPASPPAPTRATTNNAKAPVLRKFISMTATEHDNIRTDENWLDLFAESAGNKMAKNILVNLNAMLQGVLNVAGLNHLYDATGVAGTGGASGVLTGSGKTGVTGAMTVQAIRKATSLLGDQGQNVKCMLMNSAVWYDLVWDLTTNYHFSGDMSGGWIETGAMGAAMMGVDSFIISDDIVPVGVTESAGSVYYSYLFKNAFGAPDRGLGGPIVFGYQAPPRYKQFTDSRFSSTQFTYGWNQDFVLGVRGMAFGGAALPPALTDIANSSNWAAATNDTRNVGVVGIKSYGGLD